MVEPPGIEPHSNAKSAAVGADQHVSTEPTAANRPQPRATDEPSAFAACDSTAPVDVVEAALAEALTRASEAGQWAVVSQLARELDARRKAHAAANIVHIDGHRRTRGKP